MSRNKSQPMAACHICGKQFPQSILHFAPTIRSQVTAVIQQQCPDWSNEHYICHEDLAKFRGAYVEALLLSEKGELTDLEREVLESLRQHELLSENWDAEQVDSWTWAERLSDRIAAFGGSWWFISFFGLFLAVWITINVIAWWGQFDPYPFIFLNLILSCIAAIQAPVIMMSQNRQEAKDRIRAQHDYQVNLKAELEIRHLHEKIDHLLSHQWERLVKIQELQLEMLAELGRHKHD